MNVPNALTVARVLLAIPFLTFMALGTALAAWWAYDVALLLLLAAGLTDVLDGYYARKLDSTTDFGRVADPLVDKVIVCGGLILAVPMGFGVPAWIVAVVVAREFVINGLRSYVESHGRPYGSFYAGKQKMFLQFITLCAVLLLAAHWPEADWSRSVVTVLIWLVLISTLFSGLAHLSRALPVLAELRRKRSK